jgi:hypothetical protein
LFPQIAFGAVPGFAPDRPHRTRGRPFRPAHCG